MSKLEKAFFPEGYSLPGQASNNEVFEKSMFN